MRRHKIKCTIGMSILCIAICILYFNTPEYGNAKSLNEYSTILINKNNEVIDKTPTVLYSIFLDNNKNPNLSLKNIHPKLKNKQRFIVLSVQEDDFLKIALYNKDDLKYLIKILYIPNPSRPDFTGMAANYISDLKKDGIEFSNGTKLYSALPPDARQLGTPEWMYEMRWGKLYKNYYLVTIFRGSGEAIKENVMTEKDGKDLTEVLGESSIDRDLNGFGGTLRGKISISYRKKDGGNIDRVNLVPVYEKDLPPDFPKGLVQWLP